MSVNTIKDSDGTVIKAGDKVYFSFGTPSVLVCGEVIKESGHLVVLTPGHKPSRCKLFLLKKYVGDFYKARALSRDKHE